MCCIYKFAHRLFRSDSCYGAQVDITRVTFPVYQTVTVMYLWDSQFTYSILLLLSFIIHHYLSLLLLCIINEYVIGVYCFRNKQSTHVKT